MSRKTHQILTKIMVLVFMVFSFAVAEPFNAVAAVYRNVVQPESAAVVLHQTAQFDVAFRIVDFCVWHLRKGDAVYSHSARQVGDAQRMMPFAV